MARFVTIFLLGCLALSGFAEAKGLKNLITSQDESTGVTYFSGTNFLEDGVLTQAGDFLFGQNVFESSSSAVNLSTRELFTVKPEIRSMSTTPFGKTWVTTGEWGKELLLVDSNTFEVVAQYNNQTAFDIYGSLPVYSTLSGIVYGLQYLMVLPMPGVLGHQPENGIQNAQKMALEEFSTQIKSVGSIGSTTYGALIAQEHFIYVEFNAVLVQESMRFFEMPSEVQKGPVVPFATPVLLAATLNKYSQPELSLLEVDSTNKTMRVTTWFEEMNSAENFDMISCNGLYVYNAGTSNIIRFDGNLDPLWSKTVHWKLSGKPVLTLSCWEGNKLVLRTSNPNEIPQTGNIEVLILDASFPEPQYQNATTGVRLVDVPVPAVFHSTTTLKETKSDSVKHHWLNVDLDMTKTVDSLNFTKIGELTTPEKEENSIPLADMTDFVE